MVNEMFLCVWLIVFMSIGVSGTSNYDHEWKSFKIKYGKVYDSVGEEAARRLIFIENLNKINAHNDQADKGLQSYRMGINKFTDKRSEEFANTKIGLKPQTYWKPKVNSSRDLPESVDWRPTIVTSVKDQGDCYSSWAFSAVASLEGAAAQKTGRLVEFSAQNLLDCTWNYGNKGCGGGFVYAALAQAKAQGGIDTEECYPYTSSKGNDTLDCGFKASCVGTTITKYVRITEADEETLLWAVSRGVVSASILGGVLITYESGIIDVKHCDTTLLGHSVAIVGYGSENGKPYWIVKNSWGTDWGESGYFRMVRGKNMCMIAETAYYPVI